MSFETKNIIVIGYSGHAYVVIDAALEMGLKVYGYSDSTRKVSNPFNLNYLGFEGDDTFSGWGNGNSFVLGIGDNRVRENIYKNLHKRGEESLTIIHPHSSVSNSAKVSEGTFISSGSLVNSFASIGKGCIINTGAIIEHECRINDFVHIAPGAVLAGNVSVGDRTFIGANAVVKQGVEIGSDVIVGAGTVVLNDVPSHTKIVGNPGKII